MSEKTALWACARCERRKNIENVQADPTVLRVCDYCKIENWVRPVGHAGADSVIIAETVEEVADVVVESVLEEVPEPEPEELLGVARFAPEEEAKKAKIEALKAQLAELEK